MPEPMKPVTNPVLVDAMATFKLDLNNREHEIAFLQAAVEAKYLLPAQVERAEEPVKEGEQVKMRVAFQIMTNQKGDKFMPAFTDEIELRKNRKPDEKFQIVVMNFMDLYRFIKSNEGIGGVVINPFGSALCLVRPQIIAIGDNNGDLSNIPMAKPAPRPVMPESEPARPSAEEVQAAQQDAIRQAMADLEAAKAASESENAEPAASPITDDLIGALKGVLKKFKFVKKAYIGEETENDERFLLVALEADESADLTAVSEAVSTGCADYSDLALECVPASSIRAKALVAANEPVYEKKLFGIF